MGYTGKFTEIVVPLRDDYGFETGKTKIEKYQDIYHQQYSLVTGNYHDYGSKTYYTVNFGTKEGQGTITEMPDMGTIGKRYDRTMGISGNAVADNGKFNDVRGSYSLNFYGPKAEEIAGTAHLRQNDDMSYYDPEFRKFDITPSGNSYDSFDIGFGGTRGEIQK